MIAMVRLDVSRDGWIFTALGPTGHMVASWGARRVSDHEFTRFGAAPPELENATAEISAIDTAQALLAQQQAA
jgi:hypothetical protein